MKHECIIEKELDPFAYVEQYMIICRCHMDNWKLWRVGDPPFICPSEEEVENDRCD